MTNKDLPYSTGNSNPTPGHIPTETITGKHNMHPIVHWSTIYIPSRTWKQPKPPSTDEWIKKMRYIHITENYSAINKKNEIMPFVTKRIGEDLRVPWTARRSKQSILKENNPGY